MPTKEVSVSFNQDQLLLYELSLSIGRSLDTQSVCHNFLKTLCSRKHIVEASIWWPAPDAPDELVLLAALPGNGPHEKRVTKAHPYGRAVDHRTLCILTRANPEFETLAASYGSNAPIEACILFPLDGQGLLVIYAPTATELSTFRIDVAAEIVERLAIAIQGCLAHARLKQIESSSRHATPKVSGAASGNDTSPLLRALVQSMPDLVWLKDADGKYLACNNRFERYFGASESEILGHTDYDFVDKESADFFRQRDRIAIEGGRPSINEEWITFADDGHTELLETTKTPIYDADGRLTGVLGIGHDITERKLAEERTHSDGERSRHLASMLRLMCDNVPDMIWAKDLNKNYLFANKAICTNLLIARDIREPLGKSDLFFAQREREKHPERTDWHTFGELCQDSDALTIERGEPSVFIEYGNVQGKFLCLEVHKAPFVDADGRILGTIGSARDVTDRRRIEAELEQHRQHLEELVEQRTSALLEAETRATSILQSTADGLYGIDLDGRITFINPAACRILGYSEEEAIGRNAHVLFRHHRADGTPNPAEDCPVRQALIRGEELRGNNEVYWHASGRGIPVMFALHPTYNNGMNTGAVVSFIDITELRAAEQAREKALVAAENLARIKSQFLANMSHEIRTPLNGILGFAQIGQRHHFDGIKARNAFEKILTSGNRLLGIVNDVLDFSKIEAGKMVIVQSAVRLDEVIEHAVDLVSERALAKKLELIVDRSPTLPETCNGDALRLEQVLLNLLSNAVKFTERGHVALSAWRSDDWLAFRVTDTGIGINKEELQLIFNPFHQSDSTASRRFDGTGLGLAISKHLLELMGGTIEASSQPGVGSSFEFRIPYVEATAPPIHVASIDAAASRRPLAGMAILAVEDDPISAIMLEHNLIEDGASVVMAGNGLEAVDRIQREGPAAFDLILMDIQMPIMDGYEATRRIRQLAPDLPVIGQSAHVFGDEKDKCFSAGMAAHIAKPIDFSELIGVIRKHARIGQPAP